MSKQLLCCVLAILLLCGCSPTPEAPTTAATTEAPDVVSNVVPNTPWARAAIDYPGDTFVLGDSVNAFAFPAVDISDMKYLEFDIYISSAARLSNITENTQFEITSSGVYGESE